MKFNNFLTDYIFICSSLNFKWDKKIYSKFNNSHTKGLKVMNTTLLHQYSTSGFQMIPIVKEDFVAIKMCMSNLPDQLKNLM
jgi:hypothetical protein